jgi:hypothetical protein
LWRFASAHISINGSSQVIFICKATKYLLNIKMSKGMICIGSKFLPKIAGKWLPQGVGGEM